MLVLTRKTSQMIQLGDNITITVVRTSSGSVKLGIQAPPDIRIARCELTQLSEAMQPQAKVIRRALIAS
jgi:carbon storage regulator